MSEHLYHELQRNGRLVEIPVASVSVHGAVAGKKVTVKKQIQLSMQVCSQDVCFPFLVIPGLSMQLIVGIDWQMHFGMVIDCERERIKFKGEYLPENRFKFYLKPMKNVTLFCHRIRLNKNLWYKYIDNDNNPSRVVKKKNGAVRVCLDARWLNKQIESDNEAPERIDELLQDVEGIQFMSTTDFVMGYWQVPLAVTSRKYTAFLHNGRCYQFTRIPFGLKTAGAGFVRAVSLGLDNEILSKIKTYIDDFFIASRSFLEHVNTLDLLFKRLSVLGFTLSLEKSRFFCESVRFLGVVIDRWGVRADPEKLRTIQEFPHPKDRKQLQGFLGVCGFSRRFVIKHADFIAPFRDLLKPCTKWHWTQEHESAFIRLKQNFMECVTLHHVMPDRKLRLQTDASDAGICGVLYQITEENDLRIISITSRVLTTYEVKYTVTEKELLAIVYSLLKFRRYLLGVQFEIVTDHRALTFMLSTPYHNSRLMRWVLFVQEYDYEIRHCKGSDNVVADYFSRNFEEVSTVNRIQKDYLLCVLGKECVGSFDEENEANRLIAGLQIRDELLYDSRDLARLQANDDMTKRLHSERSASLEFRKENDILYCRSRRNEGWKLIVPEGLEETLLSSIHEQLGHAGGFKMHKYICRYFYWRCMRKCIKDWVRRCVCVKGRNVSTIAWKVNINLSVQMVQTRSYLWIFLVLSQCQLQGFNIFL